MGHTKSNSLPFNPLIERIQLTSPQLNRHLYWSESTLLINMSVTQSRVYQVHPTQPAFKQGQEKNASPDKKGKRTIQLKVGPLAPHLLLLCALSCETLGKALGCSQILKNKQLIPFTRCCVLTFLSHLQPL